MAAAQHWHNVAQQQQKELEELRQQTEVAYQRGKEDGEAEALNSVAQTARTVGAMTEEEEAAVRSFLP